MTITATQVNELRQRTGAGLMDCKKALEESGGDIEVAIEWLRKKGISKAAKKAERQTNEGRIFVASDKSKVAMVKFFCETDFVANNDEFQALGKELADTALAESSIDSKQGAITALIAKIGENMSAEAEVVEGSEGGISTYYLHSNGKLAVAIALSGSQDEALARDVAMQAAAMNPSVINPEDVDQAIIDKEKELWKEELSGKPENIQEQIMAGKEKKFREESSLLGQSFVKDSNKKVADILGGAKVEKMLRVEI